MFSVIYVAIVGAAVIIPVAIGMKSDNKKRAYQCVVYVGTEGVNQ